MNHTSFQPNTKSSNLSLVAKQNNTVSSKETSSVRIHEPKLSPPTVVSTLSAMGNEKSTPRGEQPVQIDSSSAKVMPEPTRAGESVELPQDTPSDSAEQSEKQLTGQGNETNTGLAPEGAVKEVGETNLSSTKQISKISLFRTSSSLPEKESSAATGTNTLKSRKRLCEELFPEEKSPKRVKEGKVTKKEDQGKCRI